MSVAFNFELNQGTDQGVQVYWLSTDEVPFPVIDPMRLSVADGANNIVATLRTNSRSANQAPDDYELPDISYNTDLGLIQLFFRASVTSKLIPGQYQYDLFVTYYDNELTRTTRVSKIMHGIITVNGRITKDV